MSSAPAISLAGIHQRFSWQDFKGRRLLMLDGSSTNHDEAYALFEHFDRLIREQADHSVLFYFDVENGYHENALTARWKKAMDDHDAKVVRVAMLGVHGGMKVVVAAYRFFARLRGVDIDTKMKFFDDPLEAKEWLVAGDQP